MSLPNQSVPTSRPGGAVHRSAAVFRSPRSLPSGERRPPFLPGGRAGHPGVFLLCLFGLLAGVACPVLAELPLDIPLVQRLGTGARPLGMGGAYTAVSDDAFALLYNPAGLAQVRRIEVTAGLQKRSNKNLVAYLGEGSESPLSRSHIQSLGFVYPFPTYRGSLVMGLSYERVAPLDNEYFRSGFKAVEEETEELLDDGSVGAYQAGLALEVSENLALGFTARLLSGDWQRDWSLNYLDEHGENWETSTVSTSFDASAVSGTLGLLVRGRQGLRLGLALHLPEQYDLELESSQLIRWQRVAGTDTSSFYDEEPYYETVTEEIDLPLRFSGGVSYAPSGRFAGLLLSVDATYSDWQEVDYDGPLRMDNRDFAYRPTTDLRVGAEYAFSAAPVRVRAGFIRQPLAYKPIVTNLFYGEYEEARIETDRHYWTVGAGVLVDRSLTIDVAYLDGGYTRTDRSGGGSIIEEEVEESRLILGAAVRW